MTAKYPQRMASPTYTPNRLINRVMEMLDVEKDADFATLLGVRACQVSRMRQKRLYISELYLVRIHDLTGLSIGEMRELMGEPREGWPVCAP